MVVRRNLWTGWVLGVAISSLVGSGYVRAQEAKPADSKPAEEPKKEEPKKDEAKPEAPSESVTPTIPPEVEAKLEAARHAVAEAIVAAQDAGLVDTSINPPPILDILVKGYAEDGKALKNKTGKKPYAVSPEVFGAWFTGYGTLDGVNFTDDVRILNPSAGLKTWYDQRASLLNRHIDMVRKAKGDAPKPAEAPKAEEKKDEPKPAEAPKAEEKKDEPKPAEAPKAEEKKDEPKKD